MWHNLDPAYKQDRRLFEGGFCSRTPYSQKFSIGENFQSVRPRVEGSKLNSAKIKSIENKILLCTHMHNAAVHDGITFSLHDLS